MTTISFVPPGGSNIGAQRAAGIAHVAILISPERFRQEAALTTRLAIGLVSEGLTVSIVEPLPEQAPDATQPRRARLERRFELPQRVRYEPRVPFWRRRDRLSRLVTAFERSVPDLVWAAGADGWELAIDFADAVDRPVALDFRRESEVRTAPRVMRSDRVVAIVAPCEALARLARTIVPEQFVRVVPMGVRVDDTFQPRIGPARVLAILGEGRDDRAFSAALRAARSALERQPELLCIVEFPSNSASVWRFARALGLLDRITAVDGSTDAGLAMTAVRACDVLMLPEPRGGPRAEALVALARGLPVIAAVDPMADALIDGETAVLLPAGDQHSHLWSDALIAALEHPEQARTLGARGRSLVLSRHRSSVAAAACLACVEDLLRGGPLRMTVTPDRPSA
jgi:glycosyltransferase involved in cell wall biosynthesis